MDPVAPVLSEVNDSKEAVGSTPPEPEVMAFPEGTLLALLTAEVAGYRGDYQYALDQYLIEAEKTLDPGVAARVTRLAAYMKADDKLYQAASLWAQADPESLEAHQFLADQLVKRALYVDALETMQTIDRLGGEAQFDYFAYRVGRMTQEDRQALLLGLNDMLTVNPNEPQILFSKAALLEALGDGPAALETADTLLGLKPAELNFIILKANLLSDLNQKQAAQAFLSEQLAINPDQPRLRLLLARLLFEAQAFSDARVQYQILHEIRPEDGEILFALAMLSIEQADFAQARLHLGRLVRTDQRVNQAQYYLGLVAEKTGDVALALREFAKVDGGYEYLSAQGRIVELISVNQSLEDARSYLAKKKLAHNGLRSQFDLIEGQLLSRVDAEDALFEHLDEAIEAQAGDIPLLYFRAMSGQKYDRLDILERDLKQVLTLDPGNADAMNALGYTLADQTDRYDEAYVLIEKALRLKPEEPAFIDSMGWVLYRLNRYEEAIDYLEQAFERFPNDEVAAHLGEVLWQSGKTRRAKRVWKEALSETPDSTFLQSVVKRFLGS
ncbi:tetratricopeptide repeat protein [Pseudomonadales bacterium]|nr:tetratricopeptide repeat protein [Gammaproteobacteria bacterium]MDA7590619.1 tetratricopeptide repeat protein [Pseudomonadales bacterium]